MPPRTVKIGTRAIRVADDQPTFWDRVEAGRWEPATLAAIDRLVDPGTTFVDLGAWVGPTALYAAGAASRVIAVEADPAALAQLRRNLAVNPELAARIEVVAAAVHAERGTVRMGARRKPGDSMSSVLLGEADQAWTAPAVTPGELAARIGKNERLVIKLDIEGGEYALLPHLAPLLARSAAVLVSFHPGVLVGALHGDRRAAARRTRAALAALNRFRAEPLGSAGGRASLAPLMVRWRLRPQLPGDEWLFTRR